LLTQPQLSDIDESSSPELQQSTVLEESRSDINAEAGRTSESQQLLVTSSAPEHGDKNVDSEPTIADTTVEATRSSSKKRKRQSAAEPSIENAESRKTRGNTSIRSYRDILEPHSKRQRLVPNYRLLAGEEEE